jgi:hypothetical protein
VDEHELRQAFRATFDGEHPSAGAVDRAFAAVADQAGTHAMGRYLAGAADRAFAAVGAESASYTLGRRLAGAAAVALALLVVATLLIARGAFAPHGTVPASRTVPTPRETVAAVPSASPAIPTPTPSEPPIGLPGVAADAVNQPPTGLVAALSQLVVLAGWSGSGQLELTGDGGSTWSALRVPEGTVLDLQWVDNDTVLASTNAGLYRYERSTAAWTWLSKRGDLVRLDFRTGTVGYAVTAAGDVVQTLDGGATLSAVDVGIHPVTWLQWVSSTHAWAAGPAGVVATSDGGATWVQQLRFTQGVVRGQVGFRDETNGFALFEYGTTARRGFIVYHTADGGATWTPESCACGDVTPATWLGPGKPATLPQPHSDLVVTGGASAMLVGSDPKTGTASICDTMDAGKSWACDPVPYEGGDATALGVKGQARWLVGKVGASGRLLASSPDAGGTWTVRRP